jgi:hypothetical protein
VKAALELQLVTNAEVLDYQIVILTINSLIQYHTRLDRNDFEFVHLQHRISLSMALHASFLQSLMIRPSRFQLASSFLNLQDGVYSLDALLVLHHQPQ